MKCMNMKARTDHIPWYTFKKIMKPSIKKTRDSKLQPRTSYTHQTSTHNKQISKEIKKEKPGNNAYHQGGGDQWEGSFKTLGG